MKKVYMIILFVLSILVIYPNRVSAALCTKTAYTELKEKIEIIEIKWNLKFDEKDNHYFEVDISNVDKDLMLKFAGNIYEPKNKKIKVSIPLEGGNVYDFKFYGGYDNPCVEEYIGTKKIEIPKYNIYSKKSECKVYTEWELCDEWYQGEIKDNNDFNKKLEEYKTKIKNGEIKLKSKKDNNINVITILTILIIIAIAGFSANKYLSKTDKKHKVVKK